MCRGLPVVDDETGDAIATIDHIVLHPDTGKVEGFLVRLPGLFGRNDLFLSSLDILRWGNRVSVRDDGVLAPLEDLVRLQKVLEEARPILHQSMRTESGRDLGHCRDVQFDTQHFVTEWLFPKKWGRWGTPVPITQVLEVRMQEILVRDSAAPAEDTSPEAVPLLETLPEAA